MLKEKVIYAKITEKKEGKKIMRKKNNNIKGQENLKKRICDSIFAKERAITLIALIVTIIILLILSGVTISILTGKNGILSKAIGAKGENNSKSAVEKVKLALLASIEKNGKFNIDKIGEGSLGENLKEIGCTEYSGSLPTIVDIDGIKIKIDEKGNVEETKEEVPNRIVEFNENLSLNCEENLLNLIDWPKVSYFDSKFTANIGNNELEQGKTHTRSEWIKIFNDAESQNKLQIDNTKHIGKIYDYSNPNEIITKEDLLFINNIRKTGYARIRLIVRNQDQKPGPVIPKRFSLNYEIAFQLNKNTYFFDMSYPTFENGGDYEYIFLRIDENIVKQGYIWAITEAVKFRQVPIVELGQKPFYNDISILYDE